MLTGVWYCFRVQCSEDADDERDGRVMSWLRLEEHTAREQRCGGRGMEEAKLELRSKQSEDNGRYRRAFSCVD